jgi:hypothetical protein
MDKKFKTVKKQKLSQPDFWKEVPKEEGVYWIYGLEPDGKPCLINRLFGSDPTGLLYVGQSKDLRERLRMLWRTIQEDYLAKAHTFGKKYKHIKKARNKFPIHSLMVRFELCSSAKNREAKVLEKYIAEFGEVPPFNSSSSASIN